MHRSPRQAAVAACALAVLTAGCGSTAAYKNTPKPPAAIVISASIDDRQVSVSPRHFGAGPITLVITNQSSAVQQVTLETADTPGAAGPGQKAVQTGPISPRETASVRAAVLPGTYALHVGGSGVKAARLVVGRKRPSAQNDLLQP